MWLVTFCCCWWWWWSKEMRILKINGSPRPEPALDPLTSLQYWVRNYRGSVQLINSCVYAVSTEITQSRTVCSGFNYGMTCLPLGVFPGQCLAYSHSVYCWPSQGHMLVFIPKTQLNHNRGITVINIPLFQGASVTLENWHWANKQKLQGLLPGCSGTQHKGTRTESSGPESRLL